jgi:hypothetical protein
MFVAHALSGRCHPKMLLHYPAPQLQPDDVVREIDDLARGLGGGPKVRSVAPLPGALLPFVGAKMNLGDLMAREVTMARLLFVASKYRNWSKVEDLSGQLSFTEGTTKNLKSRLKKELVASGLLPSDIDWSMSQFARFVVEQESFILSFGAHHLGVDHPGFELP